MPRLIGTALSDKLVASLDGDVVRARAGDDVLLGGAGRDSLFGGVGDDSLDAGRGARDRLSGGDGDDRLTAHGAAAAFLPGQGRDVAVSFKGDAAISYADLAAAVNVDLSIGTARGDLTRDAFIGVTSVIGSPHDDRLKGGAAVEWEGFAGGPGEDAIRGRGGFDVLLFHVEGGPSAVHVDLAAGFAVDTYGDLDAVAGVESVFATALDDLLYGDEAELETWRGHAGDDRIDGRGGVDRADYSGDLAQGGWRAVRADLLKGRARDGFGDRDRLVDIEELLGTHRGDALFGDAGDNRLMGGAGPDRLRGRGGADRLEGGPGGDRLSGGPGEDVFRYARGDGRDRILDFDPEQDRLRLIDVEADGFHELVVRDAAKGAVLRLSAGARIRFDGVEAEELGPWNVWLD